MASIRKFVVVKNRTEIIPFKWGQRSVAIHTTLIGAQLAATLLREEQPLTDWDVYELVAPIREAHGNR